MDQQTSSVTDENEERLENLREWYHRRSKEFSSPNYEKYKCNKEMSTNLAKEHSEYERKQKLQSAMARTKFNADISSISSTYYKPMNQLPNEEICKKEIKLTMPSSYISPTPLLKPETLLVFSEESEHDSPISAVSNSQTEFADAQNENLPKNFNQISPNPIISKEDVPNINNKTAETTQKFCVPADPQISEPKFSLWVKTYSKLHLGIQKEIESFEKNSDKKEIRMHLTRTLVERINDCAKRNCSAQELAQLSIFLGNLFEGKSVKSWKDGEFVLNMQDRGEYFYAMNTIFARYFEQIKWDTELMDQILFVLLLLFRRRPLSYQVFCSKIATSLILLNFNMENILSKINSIAHESSEISSKWIQNEQTTFRLFCRVQIGICSTPDNILQQQMGDGPIELVTIFTEIIEVQKPFPLCTSFVLEGILSNASKQLIKDLGPKLIEKYIPLIRKNILATEEKLRGQENRTQFILITRQNFLNGLLEDALTRIEGQINSKN